jgi:ribonuclease HI
LGEIVRNREAEGRIAKWSVELMGETLTYAPRKAIKSQVLADFVAEWTDTQLLPPQIQAECWIMYFDGSVMKSGAGAGLLFISPLGDHMRYVICLHFPASNNMAEYEALLSGLRIAIELGVKCLDVRGDSQLIIDQVMKESSCHDPKIEAYCKAVCRLEDKFDVLELNHVPRKYNEDADELAKIASGRTTVPRTSSLVTSPSPPPNSWIRRSQAPRPSGPSAGNPPADEAEPMDIDFGTTSADEAEAMEVDEAPTSQDWRVQYLDWMIRGVLPSNRIQAWRLARRAKSFVIINNELYKRSPSGVLQRCIPIPEGKELICDIHAGICGHHAAPRTLVGNAFRQGFYWPTTVADATGDVRTCEGCQFYARKTHLLAHALQTIPITWPFSV